MLSERAGCLHYRQLSAPLPAGTHPDDQARALSRLTACTPGAVLHSTSWRYHHPGVVLTYAALPDLAPGGDTVPVLVDAAAAGVPLAPSPARLDLDAVASHACRHLALLATTDGEVALAAKAQPGVWELLAKLVPGTPGGLNHVVLKHHTAHL